VIQKTCTCSRCGGTFVVVGNTTPTFCALCGAKFDIVTENPAPGFSPIGPPSIRPGGPPASIPSVRPEGPETPAAPPPVFPTPTAPDQHYTANADGAGTGRTLFAEVVLWIIIAFGGVTVVLILLGGVMMVMMMVGKSGSAAPRQHARRPRKRRSYDA
jgi:hypothetical protein